MLDRDICAECVSEWSTVLSFLEGMGNEDTEDNEYEKLMTDHFDIWNSFGMVVCPHTVEPESTELVKAIYIFDSPPKACPFKSEHNAAFMEIMNKPIDDTNKEKRFYYDEDDEDPDDCF